MSISLRPRLTGRDPHCGRGGCAIFDHVKPAARHLAALVLFQCLAAPVLVAQTIQGEPSSFQSFRSLVSRVDQVSDVQLVRHVRIAWSAIPPPPGASVAAREPRGLALIDQQVEAGRLRRERLPQLSQDRPVVVVQDPAGAELDWRLVPNPAIVRAEAPGPDGCLQGTVIELDSTELSIAIPAIQSAHRIHLYRPYWNGAEYLLEPLGHVDLQP